MREWQQMWDTGTTGRWMHELWNAVTRNGCDASGELTQVATDHGDFKAYLNRFGLNNNGDERCECRYGREDTRHVVPDCPLPGRAEARERLRRDLGHVLR